MSALLAVASVQGAGFLQVIEQKAQDGSPTLLVQAQGVPLGEVLREIADESGIQFKVPERLMKEPVTLDIAERNWTSVIDQVLIGYNSVYIWNGPTRLDHVFLLGSNEASEISPLPLNTPGEQKRNLPTAPHLTKKITKKIYYRPNAPGEQKRITPKGLRADLSEAQLKKVASGAVSSPLSEKLFEDSKIKKFLEQNGVKTIKDGKRLILALKVRRQASKILKEIKRMGMKNN